MTINSNHRCYFCGTEFQHGADLRSKTGTSIGHACVNCWGAAMDLLHQGSQLSASEFEKYLGKIKGVGTLPDQYKTYEKCSEILEMIARGDKKGRFKPNPIMSFLSATLGSKFLSDTKNIYVVLLAFMLGTFAGLLPYRWMPLLWLPILILTLLLIAYLYEKD
jgi:hypothetical protein